LGFSTSSVTSTAVLVQQQKQQEQEQEQEQENIWTTNTTKMIMSMMSIGILPLALVRRLTSQASTTTLGASGWERNSSSNNMN
jgi:hypothetical protein